MSLPTAQTDLFDLSLPLLSPPSLSVDPIDLPSQRSPELRLLNCTRSPLRQPSDPTSDPPSDLELTPLLPPDLLSLLQSPVHALSPISHCSSPDPSLSPHTPILTMPTTTPPMPARGDRAAPTFDQDNPRDLRRYLQDLEARLSRLAITNLIEKKKYVIRYVDIATSELWESLPQFTSATATYDNFLNAIHHLYPGADDKRKWAVADMDTLVGKRSRIGIHLLGELAEFHRRFLAITTFLISKNRLSTAEQNCGYLCRITGNLKDKINAQLQLLDPNHYPDDPWPLTQSYEAVRYLLHGTSSSVEHSLSSLGPTSKLNSLPVILTVKTEDLKSVLDTVMGTFFKAMTSMTGNQ